MLEHLVFGYGWKWDLTLANRKEQIPGPCILVMNVRQEVILLQYWEEMIYC